MGKGCLVALVTALVATLGLGQGAEAGVTYDFAFRSTDIDGTPIAGGSAVNGGRSFSFASTAAANANPGVVLDVLMRTTDPLIGASVSVVYDNSNGLAAASVVKWFGQGVAFNMMGDPIKKFFAWRELACEDSLPVAGVPGCQPFGGVILPPSGPPSLPAGTYHIGTLIWDTSSLDGASVVMTEILSINGTAAVIDGEKRDITGTEVTKQGLINIIPEPATAGLMGLGLVGLALVGLRRRAR